MSLSTLLAEIVTAIEAIPVTEGPPYRHARSDNQARNDRAFTLDVVNRVGPRRTGTRPLVDFTAALELVTKSRQNDLFADMERLSTEGAALARTLELFTAFSPDSAVVVNETSYDFGDDFNVATIELQLTLREAG